MTKRGSGTTRRLAAVFRRLVMYGIPGAGVRHCSSTASSRRSRLIRGSRSPSSSPCREPGAGRRRQRRTVLRPGGLQNRPDLLRGEDGESTLRQGRQLDFEARTRRNQPVVGGRPQHHRQHRVRAVDRARGQSLRAERRDERDDVGASQRADRRGAERGQDVLAQTQLVVHVRRRRDLQTGCPQPCVRGQRGLGFDRGQVRCRPASAVGRRPSRRARRFELDTGGVPFGRRCGR